MRGRGQPCLDRDAFGGLAPCWHGWQLHHWPLLLVVCQLTTHAGALWCCATLRMHCLTLLLWSIVSSLLTTHTSLHICSSGTGHGDTVLHKTLRTQLPSSVMQFERQIVIGKTSQSLSYIQHARNEQLLTCSSSPAPVL